MAEHSVEIEPRCSCGPHAIVFGTVPDPGCPVHIGPTDPPEVPTS